MAPNQNGRHNLAGWRISMECEQLYLQSFCRGERTEGILKLGNERASAHFGQSALTRGEYVLDKLCDLVVCSAVKVAQFLLRSGIIPKAHAQHRPRVRTLVCLSALLPLARIGCVLQ